MFGLALFLFSFFSAVWAGSPAASTIVLNQTEIVFSLNLPSNSSDLYFAMSAPTRSSWTGVGVGNEMAGSLMFIVYAASGGNSITLSPRIGTGNTEPAYAPEIDIEVLEGSTVVDESFNVYALCRNCRNWTGGYIDMDSDVQPWIYALGPHLSLVSTSPSAGLRRHDKYGAFTMSMIQATGEGGVPSLTDVTQDNGANPAGPVHSDGDKASIFHAIALCLAVFALYPFNMIIIEVFRWRKVGTLFSVIFQLFLLIGLGLGSYVSTEYIRSKKFNSPHQILGFIVLAGFILDGIFGRILLIRQRKAEKNGDVLDLSRITSIHGWVKRTLCVLAVIDGGIGLAFASSPTYVMVAYSLCAILIFLCMLPCYYCLYRRHAKKRKERELGRDNIKMTDNPPVYSV